VSSTITGRYKADVKKVEIMWCKLKFSPDNRVGRWEKKDGEYGQRARPEQGPIAVPCHQIRAFVIYATIHNIHNILREQI
jgi:hypothetical protein